MADAVRQPRWSLPAVVSIAVGLLFAASVAGKLLSPTATLEVLRDVWHFPAVLVVGTFVLLCAAEAGLCGGLLTLPGARLPLLAAAGFVAIVSASLVLQIVTGAGGSCGCGLSDPLDLGRWGPWVGLIRNAAIVTAVFSSR